MGTLFTLVESLGSKFRREERFSWPTRLQNRFPKGVPLLLLVG